MNVFYKETKPEKMIYFFFHFFLCVGVGGRVRGGGGLGRWIFFTKNPNLNYKKKKKFLLFSCFFVVFFFLGGGGGAGGMLE